MKKQLLSLLVAGASGLCLHAASATNYAGNGNTGFNGAVGNGILSVTNNASGAFVFSFTLGGFQTGFGGNDLVIYIDNGKGGGIGNTTAGLTDTADGGRRAVSEFSANGTDRSTVTFGNLMSPQLALDFSYNNGNVYGLVNGGTFAFNGGQQVGNAGNNGVTYTTAMGNGTSTSTVFTLTVPAAALGLSVTTANTINLFGMQISETGYSSNEATVGITGGNFGYGTTQTITGVNSFTSTAVPEPGTWGMLLLGGVGTLLVVRRRGLTAR